MQAKYGLSLIIIAVFLNCFTRFQVYSQQLFSGNVRDKISLNPVNNAEVFISEINRSAITDSSGSFSFYGLKFRTYRIHISAEQYKSLDTAILFDSLFSSANLLLRLIPFESSVDTIDVNSILYKKNDDIHTANTYAVYEELRKTPGTVEDIIKYFQSSMGVTFASDLDNDIIVRGGSPIENLTTIDGIEILNPNHYGPPGSTSGALSFINLKLVDEVNFYAGGFPVKYGDRISSVMDIRLKEGDNKRHWRDLNISMTGFGGFFEGPISKKINYMVSVRRSYLELLRKNLNMNYLPNYWDVNMKLSYNINKTDNISYIGLFAYDRANFYNIAKDSVDKSSTPVDLKLLTTGFNYTQNRRSGVFSFIVSDNYSFYDAGLNRFNIRINDNQLKLSSEYKKPLSLSSKVDLTAEVKSINSRYDVFSYYYASPTGYFIPTISYVKDISTFRFGASANFISEPVKHKLSFNAGVRFDYSALMNKGFSVSPRFGLSYKLFPVTSLNLNLGVYTQQPEFLWLLSGSNADRLSNIKVNEAILGIEHFFTSDIRANIEGYIKYYSGYPVSLYDPYYIFINISGIYPSFLGEAQSTGEGYYRGVDFTIEKKNPGNGFYGTLNISLAHSSFSADMGGYQPGDFDHQQQVLLVAGYHFPIDLILSFRLKYTDGRPYTRYDRVSSYILGYGVFDMSHYGKDRLPYYLRLDLRVDKILKIGRTQLIGYIEVWNVLNRKNVYDINYYNTNYHWSRVPVLGLSYRF